MMNGRALEPLTDTAVAGALFIWVVLCIAYLMLACSLRATGRRSGERS